MIDTVYSIGYSGFTIDAFLSTLRKNCISLIVDVRSQPHSKWFSDYNKENLEKTLKQAEIYYRNYAEEFGARQENRNFYTSEGYLDFELFAKSPQFLEGVRKLKNAMEKNYCFALMCAEKDPFNCHRTMLVSRAFHDAGYQVIHLLPNDRKVTHKEIETRLLDTYFPDRNQQTLFGELFDDDEYLRQAYAKRNAEIGYSIEEA